jgi:hypothetical protein
VLTACFENNLTDLNRRIAGVVSEGLNSTIPRVEATARDFCNQQNFINASYFHCDGLDLAAGH